MAIIQRWGVASTRHWTLSCLSSFSNPSGSTSECCCVSIVPRPCLMTENSSHGKMASASLHFPNLRWVHHVGKNKLYWEPQLARCSCRVFYFSNPYSRPRLTTPHRHHAHWLSYGKRREGKPYFAKGRACGSLEGKGRENFSKRKGLLFVDPT